MGENLKILADLEPTFKKFNKEEKQIKGKITVENLSDYPQRYGNSSLFLIINKTIKARTYKDSIASEVINFSTVEINKGSKISLPVYWVFEIKNIETIETIELFYEAK